MRYYAVSVADWPESEEVMPARSAGAAKYRRWLSVTDCYPDIPITAMRARAIRDTPPEPRRFRECVERRRIPFAKIGLRVLVDGKPGAIVGSNDSSNLDVLFDGERLPGNCHPWWRVVYLDEQGNPIPFTAPA